LKIGHFLTLNKLDLRKIFGDRIYDQKIDKHEFELLSFRDFSDFSKIFFKLSEKHIAALSIMLSDHFIGDSFNFNFLEEIFVMMGLAEKKADIDNRSIRILQRLNTYLRQKEQTAADALKDISF